MLAREKRLKYSAQKIEDELGKNDNNTIQKVSAWYGTTHKHELVQTLLQTPQHHCIAVLLSVLKNEFVASGVVKKVAVQILHYFQSKQSH